MLDSGATSHMIKDESLFIEIDKDYTGKITNANSSKWRTGDNWDTNRGLKRVWAENKIAKRITCTWQLDKNLVSVSKLRAADNEVLFGKDLELRNKNGTSFPFEEHDISFFKIENSTCSENCNLASGDRLILWLKLIEHNNIEDLLKLKDHVIRLKVGEQDLRIVRLVNWISQGSFPFRKILGQSQGCLRNIPYWYIRAYQFFCISLLT